MTAVGRHALVGSNPTPGAITSTATDQLLAQGDGREMNPDPESVRGQPVFPGISFNDLVRRLGKRYSRVAGIKLLAPFFLQGSRQLERFSGRIRVYNAE
jgi:hypothetical protein